MGAPYQEIISRLDIDGNQVNSAPKILVPGIKKSEEKNKQLVIGAYIMPRGEDRGKKLKINYSEKFAGAEFSVFSPYTLDDLNQVLDEFDSAFGPPPMDRNRVIESVARTPLGSQYLIIVGVVEQSYYT